MEFVKLTVEHFIMNEAYEEPSGDEMYQYRHLDQRPENARWGERTTKKLETVVTEEQWKSIQKAVLESW